MPLPFSRRMALAAALLTVSSVHAFPERPVTFLIPFGAGSSPDTLARDLAQAFTTATQQPVVVENRLGAEGAIAARVLANAQPDGHTLMFTSSSMPVLDPLTKKNLAYDAVKDLVPICAVARIDILMNVTGSSSYKTADDVIAAAKAHPGKITFAYTSATTRLAAELFQQTSGIKLFGVPYKSSVAALTDVSGGQVDLVFIDPIVSGPFYQSNKLRPLLVAGPQRSKAVPQAPSATEAGLPGFTIRPWFGLFASSKLPASVLAQVREATARAVRMPAAAAAMEKRGVEPIAVCGDEVIRFQAQEIEFWRGVIQKAGIEPQ